MSGLKMRINYNKKIINVIRDSLYPSTLGLFDVLIEKHENKDIIHIIVSSGSEKPYCLSSQGMTPKGCFIRVGATVQPMNKNLIDELYSKRTRTTLKNIVSHHQDLTFEQLKIYYEAQGINLNKNFAKNLDLLTDDGRYNYIAYLLADKNATSIKAAKYWGKDKLKLREYKEYGYCSLIKATKSVLEKLDVENAVSAKITSITRKEQPLWNTSAVREAVINAIVHNDYTDEVPPVFEIYSDRLEITSCGSLVAGLSKEEFFSGVSRPRNRELMRIFKDLDLVEHIGSGMGKILSVYDKSAFTFMEHFMRIVIPFNVPESSGKSSGKILELLRDNPQITNLEIAEILGITERAVQKNIKVLKDSGKLERIGSNRAGYWKIL